MHADDTNYTVINNGILAVSGTGPAIRVADNKLIIRDGPQETPPLVLTRAEASRKLRHIIMCGQAGGYVTFDALRWLRDTDVAFSQIAWDGSIVIASGPRGPDRAALRRSQVLTCSGARSETAIAIAREILRVKLLGQATVARTIGRSEATARIADYAAQMAQETDGGRLLSIEAKAAVSYWAAWNSVPVRFARRNPDRFDHRGRWRPGRSEAWYTFGSRASTLTGKPWRATTPANAILNYLVGSREPRCSLLCIWSVSIRGLVCFTLTLMAVRRWRSMRSRLFVEASKHGCSHSSPQPHSAIETFARCLTRRFDLPIRSVPT
jgi:hypothetical protein